MSLIEASNPIGSAPIWEVKDVGYIMGYSGIPDLEPPLTEAEVDTIVDTLNLTAGGIGIIFNERQKAVKELAEQIAEKAGIVTDQLVALQPVNPIAAV